MERTIAYFSMEIALEASIPTYAGGLGVLAGDTMRSFADLEVPVVGVSLVHRKGYFRQRLGDDGEQREEDQPWNPADELVEMGARVSVEIEGRKVQIRAWRFEVAGVTGYRVPVYLLDTDLAANAERDRGLTDHLYGGDDEYRLCQEVVLGVGGVRMLRALGHVAIAKYHMNEGHSALLTAELLDAAATAAGRDAITRADIERVRAMCIFTTHTPVPAGHDQFSIELARRVLSGFRRFLDCDDVFAADVWSRRSEQHEPTLAAPGRRLNMTYLALDLSSYVNGVAKRHGETTRHLFAGYEIDAITNGIHVTTWASAPFRELFDRRIPGWVQDAFMLRHAIAIPRDEIWSAHEAARARLFETVRRQVGVSLDPNRLTLGFARRMTRYKRSDLLFEDVERLRRIGTAGGGLQVVYAGKAHPRDDTGKELIRRVFAASRVLGADVPVVFLPNYDMGLAREVTSGVDVWLNTPLPPNEASGTSGMKAALNGVPSLSVLDGWWIEGSIDGVTGWAIGSIGGDHDSTDDARSMYEQLETRILPLFHRDRNGFIDVMRHAIALNSSFFNTQRMVGAYVVHAYVHRGPEMGRRPR